MQTPARAEGHDHGCATNELDSFSISTRQAEITRTIAGISDVNVAKAVDLLLNLVTDVYSALLLKIEKEVSLEVASSLRRRALFETGVLNQKLELPQGIQQLFSRPALTTKPVAESEWLSSESSSVRSSGTSAPPMLESIPAATIERQAEEPHHFSPLIARSLLPVHAQQARASSEGGKDRASRLGAIRSGELEEFADAGTFPLWMRAGFNTRQDFGPSFSKARSSPRGSDSFDGAK